MSCDWKACAAILYTLAALSPSSSTEFGNTRQQPPKLHDCMSLLCLTEYSFLFLSNAGKQRAEKAYWFVDVVDVKGGVLLDEAVGPLVEFAHQRVAPPLCHVTVPVVPSS